ncbi:MAG: MBL fold metallo-hydrolase [Christensenellales bacterium]|jgi:hydroxyacylglutathione hydrolase
MLRMIHVRTKRMQGNAYLLYDDESKEAAIVDADFGAEKLVAQADNLGLRICFILLTHGHFDHIGALDMLKRMTGAPVYIGIGDEDMLADNFLNMSFFSEKPLNRCIPDRLLTGGEKIPLGNSEILVYHTPGHTAGSLCYLADPYLCSGDTLFSDAIGATHFPGGNKSDMKASLRLLAGLPGDLLLLPGHDKSSKLGAAIRQVSGGFLW